VPTKTCRECGEDFEGKGNVKTCNPCRAKAGLPPAKTPGARKTSVEKAGMRHLAFDRLDDEVREVLREEVRAQITQHVRDNMLGAVEVLTNMLPLGLAAIHKDLQSPDWVERRDAYKILLQYAMKMPDVDPNANDSRVLNIITNVPIPDTPLGKRVEHYIANPDEIIDLGPEEFEKDWPTCASCAERKHPSTFYTVGGGREDVCKTCHYKTLIRSGTSDLD
jgi:hypothetical protein